MHMAILCKKGYLQPEGFATKGWRIYLGVFQLLASTLETFSAIFPIDHS
jgi:hypothetical protein